MLEEEQELDVERQRREEARGYVQKLKGFYTHLGIYLAVNALLHLVNLFASDGY